MLKTRINETLNQLSKIDYTHPISIRPEIGEIFYSLARNLKPKIIVEIGAFLGYSAICFAQAIEDNECKDGKVYSIDLFLPHTHNPLYLSDDIHNPLEFARKNIEKARLQHRIDFLQGNSIDIAPKLLSSIQYIDILFIDGDHTYKGAINDYNAYHEKVKQGGLIIFHDIYPQKCDWWGPRILIDILRKRFYKKYYEILELETPDGFGIAICKKLVDGKIHIKNGFILECVRKSSAYFKEEKNLIKGIEYFKNLIKTKGKNEKP
jgi:predicted O-methyltransferase YrrM